MTTPDLPQMYRGTSRHSSMIVKVWMLDYLLASLSSSSR